MTERRSLRDQRAYDYDREAKEPLIQLYARGFRRADGHFMQGITPIAEVRRWRRDEIISSLLDMEFGHAS